MRIKLKSGKYNIDFNLNEKLTVITGDSGKGKTSLVYNLTSNSIKNLINIEVSDDFNIINYTEEMFIDYLKKYVKKFLRQNQNLDLNFNLTNNKKNKVKKCKYFYEILKSYNKRKSFNIDNLIYLILEDFEEYNKKEDNNLFYQNVVFLDDVDFINSIEFSIIFNSDKSSYFVSINRENLNRINYSIGEKYILKKDRTNYSLIKEFNYSTEQESIYKLKFENEPTSNQIVFIEDEGSGKKVFENIFIKNILTLKGKDNIISILQNYKNCNIFLIADFCSLGYLINDIYSLCLKNNINLTLIKNYESFEHFILISKFINDTNLTDFIDKNILRFKSKEELYLSRLTDITKNKLYTYTKSYENCNNCYILNCGILKDCILEDCDKFNQFRNKNKYNLLLDKKENDKLQETHIF